MALTKMGTHPTAVNQSTALGKSLTALHLRGGVLWPGYGDTFVNTGPIAVYKFDPAGAVWTNVLTASTERVGRFRAVGADLWSANDDPRGSIDPGFCKLEGPGGVGNSTVNGRVSNLLSANASSVETDVTPWNVGADMTKAQSTTWAGDGTKSLLVTRVNTTGPLNTTLAPGERIAVTPGRLYGALATIKPASNRTCRIDFLWYNADGALIGETVSVELATTTAGTAIYGNGQAPVGAATAGIRVGQLPGVNSAAGDSIAFDKFSIHRYSFLEWVLGGSSGTANWRPVHLYDFAERAAGDIYTVGNIGVTGGAGMLRSGDNGATWTLIHDVLGSPKRFYNVGALNGKVYTVLGDTSGTGSAESYILDVGEACYVFDGTSTSRGPVLGGFIHPLPFAGRLVYRGTDDQLRSFDGATVTVHRGARLHAVGSELCWIVDAGRLYSSSDLTNWSDRGPAPAGATSLAAV